MLKIGITGHRNLYDHNKVKSDLKSKIQKILADNNATEFESWTSLAYGADTLFAEVSVESFSAPLKIILPFNQKEYENDFDTPQRLNNLKSWTSKYNDAISVINPNPIQNQEERDDAYYNAGIHICNRVDVMIAVYDNEKPEGKGGTGDIVEYCEQKGIKLYKIEAYKSKIQMLRKTTDTEAMKAKKTFFLLWYLCVLFSWVSALAVSIIVPFKEKITNETFFLLVTLEAALIFAVFVIVAKKFKKKKGIRDTTIIKRRETERLRVLETYDKLNIQITPLTDVEYISEAVKQIEIDLSKKTLKKFDLKYSKKKLKELIDDQIHYHSQIRAKKIEKPLDWAENIQTALEVLFAITVLCEFFSAAIELDYFERLKDIHMPHEILLFAALILPPSYIAIESIKFLNEWKRLMKESKNMILFFETAKNDLDKVTSSDELQLIANSIRQKMDEENSSWTILIDSKEKPTGM
ncbi:hypothetical protein [Flavobacterium wongokense]|uniref:hypothetical protein n=1 Tax=Flavobacterium wongokense TaxID=2910674 RepID=UPI001F2A506D|nr:hypothetical protein [Flavobacterium sp. WG47]MCF6131873.1 hypothetical protein [Flavobacterium sp. WG47]